MLVNIQRRIDAFPKYNYYPFSENAMNMVKLAVHRLNHQQLYALVRQAQWSWAEPHFEDKFIIMMGI